MNRQCFTLCCFGICAFAQHRKLSRPQDWFLSAAEISGESCGRDRSRDVGNYPGLAAWTSGNKVDFIPDGKTYFQQIKQEVDASSPGDEIYGAGWTFSSKSEMSPSEPHGRYYDCMDEHGLDGMCDAFGLCSLAGFPFAQNLDKDELCCTNPIDPACTSVEGVFARASARGVTLRILSWMNAVPGTNGGTLLKYSQGVLHEHFFNDASSKSVVVLDGRQVDGLSSIHQKFYSFVRPNKDPISFVGGIDLGNCRMDTTDAKLGEGFRRLSLIEQCGGWLDQGVRIEGPAASDVANTFVQRWNWKGDLKADQFHTSADEFNERWAAVLPKVQSESEADDAPAPETNDATSTDDATSTQHVQILRTYSCYQQGPFAPCGEFTVLAALLKVIGLAQRYIFIEDQYGFSMEPLRDALQAAKKRGVVIVAVLNMYGAELPSIHCSGSGGHMWNCLREDGAAIFEYNMGEYGDYVHSKTWIVDDCWFMTGSANINWRSMTNDEELSAAVMDESCHSFSANVHHKNWVKRARCRMWAELASVEARTAAEICSLKDETTTDMDTLVKGVFGTSFNPVAKKLVNLGTYDGALASLSHWACGLTDPDGQCKDAPCYLAHTDFSTDSTTHGAAGSQYCQAGKTKDYRITVQTADGFLSGFGTDSDMDLRITGTLGSTGWIRLNRLSSSNLFEDADRDVLTFKACDVGEAQKVELDFYDNYPASDWCLEYIDIQGCGRWKYTGWFHEDTRVKAVKPSFTCDRSNLDANGNYNGPDRDAVEYTCGDTPQVQERTCANQKKPTDEELRKQYENGIASKGRLYTSPVSSLVFFCLSIAFCIS